MGTKRTTSRAALVLIGVVAIVSASCITPPPSHKGGTAHTTVGDQTISVSTPVGQSITVAAADPESVPSTPTGLTFPVGALDVDVHGVSPGSVATLTLTLDTPVSAVRKLVNGVWDPFVYDGTTGAQISADGKTITAHVRDGGRGDADGVANGVITDPIAPTDVDPDALAADMAPQSFPAASTDDTPVVGDAPFTVQYNLGRTNDPDSSQFFFIWTLPDGSTSTDPTPSYTFTSPGEYSAYLYVYDELGLWDRGLVVVEVCPCTQPGTTTTIPGDGSSTSTTTTTAPNGGSTTTTQPPSNTTSTTEPPTTEPPTTLPGTPNTPPTANASADLTSGSAPLEVQFSSLGSVDPDGVITDYSWDFNDATAPSTDPNPTHTFSEPGAYRVILTVTDNDGYTDTDAVEIDVASGS